MPEQPTWPEAIGAPAHAVDDRIASRYRLVAPLASGGMAQVWRAVDEVLARPVAVKVLHPHLASDPDFVARFRREAVAAARLAHPRIVAIYDTCTDPEAIVMELVEGRTLRDELDHRGFLSAPEAIVVATHIAEALDVAHRAGIIHRDIKPGNVLLGVDGTLKVTDFGIAKAVRPDEDPLLPDLTQHGQLVGTAKYLAPEQVEGGTVDARTDVYALGVVLYEMLCGRAPFDGANDQAIAVARLKGPPPRPRSVLRTIPGSVDKLVMKALSRAKEDRQPNAAALRAELLNVLGDDDDHVETVLAADEDEPAVSFARAERGWLVPTALVVLVSAALGVAWLLIGGTQARRDLIGLVDAVTPGRIDDLRGRRTVEVTVSARPFDPFGDGTEHDQLAELAVDDDPESRWRTERYGTRRLGGLKPGVGLILDAGATTSFDRLSLVSESNDWSFEVYVAGSTPATLAEWGSPVASRSAVAPGTTSLGLGGASGRAVLIWITDLGDGVGVFVDIADASVAARA